ncbi:MAG: hypothetical protein MJZ41_03345 [Bacteroidaceae bacterium]|nr:hypothetical protein [Bacteroidaceae bacterium]
MKKFISLSAIVICALLSSCGLTQNSATNVNTIQTNVVLKEANYRVIGQVKGESKQSYMLFLIGGLSKHSCEQSAIQDMFNKADLRYGARAIVNVNVMYRNQGYILFGKKKAVATGTLIEFIDKEEK